MRAHEIYGEHSISRRRGKDNEQWTIYARWKAVCRFMISVHNMLTQECVQAASCSKKFSVDRGRIIESVQISRSILVMIGR